MGQPDGVIRMRSNEHTSGEWTTESEAATAFDAYITPSGLFRIYPEVPGELIQPRVGQVNRTVRIDRVLIPTRKLLDLGWTLGAVGVEVKRSDTKIGPALAQAMDYTRSAFGAAGVRLVLGAVFLWPCEKQYGAVASLMEHNRVGCIPVPREGQWGRLAMFLGESTVCSYHLRTGATGVSNVRSGTKVGSR